MKNEFHSIVEKYQFDKTRLMDILWDIHNQHGYISDESVSELSLSLNMSPFDIRETSSFYHFFHDKPAGKHQIYLSDTVIAKMGNYDEIRVALEKETTCAFGKVDESGTFGLYHTNCIGLSDQEPAMMIDKVVFTNLTTKKVIDIISALKQGKSAEKIANPKHYVKTDVAYIDAMISTDIRKKGAVFFKKDRNYHNILSSCLSSHPEAVIETVLNSNIRGHGGAGFPTGLKWKLCREAVEEAKYVICNADEGEPGTFKDRVLLTRSPIDVIMGMVMCGYSIGSSTGIIYLRAEYWYLKEFLEGHIRELEKDGLLGDNILGKDFSFSIRIQMGAGSYVCGDETALIESCEGKRGTPRLKPPYPVQEGYLGKPTSINNVETFAAISRIIPKGANWYCAMGTKDSTGTRLLSVSGDCDYHGIYEIEWGMTLHKVLDMVGARESYAVQVSGPSGECVSVRDNGERIFCYSDLSCNGSLMIFNQNRNLLEIVHNFMEFFAAESCGVCTPCRAGNVELVHKIKLVRAGKATQEDLDDIVNWGTIIKSTSRCGLGMSSPHPLLNTLKQFQEIYEKRLAKPNSVLKPSFDINSSISIHKNLYKKFQEGTQ